MEVDKHRSSSSANTFNNNETSKIHRYKFTPQEDTLLVSLVTSFGTKNWNAISQMMNGRSPRQCRDRWNHYLTPTTNTDSSWSAEEDEIIIKELKRIGKQWTYIASLLPGRTSIAVRNRSCKLSRQKNCDPVVKHLLKDEYKRKKNVSEHSDNAYQSPMSPPPTSSPPCDPVPKIMFPSCEELIKKIKPNAEPMNGLVFVGLPFLVI